MKAKKIMAAFLAVVMTGSVAAGLAACDRRTSTERPIDESKTTLYVSNYNGGYGTEWLYQVRDKFEEAYKDTPFEEGKVGVQVEIRPNKNKAQSINFATETNDIFFTEEVKYFDLVSQGRLLDITDVVEDVIAQEGVDLTDLQKTGLQYNGKYYALPHYETAFAINYDKDYFHNEKLYKDKSGNWCNSDGDLSVGPDGQPKTYDDGLPATMEEFFELCDYIKNVKKHDPLIITGESVSKYSTNLVNRIAAAYNGYDVTQAFYTFNAENVEYVTSVQEAPGTTLGYTYETATAAKIDNSNGYLLQQTTGKLYGLAFLEKMLQNWNNNQTYFDAQGKAGTTTMLQAQEYFINSRLINEPIAMLLDGIWWENEASDAFTRSEDLYGSQAKKENRHFGIMPIPVRIDENDDNPNGNPNVAIDMYMSYGFIKSNISESKINAAKEFLKFCYSAENLSEFTRITGAARALEYELADGVYEGLSDYGKDVWDMHVSGMNVAQLSSNPLFYENEETFDSLELLTTDYATYPYTKFVDTNDPVTADEWFKKTWKWNETTWKEEFDQYITAAA